MTKQEIERKFVVKSLPEAFEKYPHDIIRQGYLAVTADGTEVRLRQRGECFFQTVKSGKGLQRTEAEIELGAAQFETLWSMVLGQKISKTRYRIPHGDLTIELDIFRGDLTGLLVAEVEFTNKQRAEAFIPPDWFGEEVTDDERYKNKNLALKGPPSKSL